MKVLNLGGFLKKRAPAGVVGGLWAMIPDLDYFLEEPVFKGAAWNDIFFFHSSFDKVVPETDLFFAAEIFLIFVAVNLFAIAATVESLKRLNEALFGKKEEEEEEEAEEGVEEKGPAEKEEGKEEIEEEEEEGVEEEGPAEKEEGKEEGEVEQKVLCGCKRQRI
ncbi:MAG: hypothetical protein V3U20_11450 [Thermoplasmata archaeon]